MGSPEYSEAAGRRDRGRAKTERHRENCIAVLTTAKQTKVLYVPTHYQFREETMCMVKVHVQVSSNLEMSSVPSAAGLFKSAFAPVPTGGLM
jgi:hypothetical protein